MSHGKTAVGHIWPKDYKVCQPLIYVTERNTMEEYLWAIELCEVFVFYLNILTSRFYIFYNMYIIL